MITKNCNVAVVTGATGGLGSRIALALHRSGYRVAVNYLSGEPEARALAGIAEDTMMPLMADVGSFEETSRMAEHVGALWSAVSVVVNNAAVTADSLLVKQHERDWDRVLRVNLKGAFNTIRAFVPLMTEGGHILNVSSFSGLKGREGQAAYSASKAALLGLTKTAAQELAGMNIRVNALLPGFLSAGMGVKAERALRAATDESILHTLSDPDEAARFVVYLVGTDHITGQVFCLDSRIM